MSGYDVGYGKPPTHSQFKPGQSGNPKGRPKGSKSLATLIEAELDRTIVVDEGTGPKKITRREALVKQTVGKAIKGDPKALQFLLSLDKSRAPEPDEQVDGLSDVDRELLSEIFAPLSDGQGQA